MIARAPGKLVVSGAYAVLEGAPAIVTAVDRWVVADTARPAEYFAPEVKAALREDQRAPWYDVSGLRHGDQKLGLGSSAAILVASLGALVAEERGIRDEAKLRGEVLRPALLAHRKAQGGGSGIDVAAAVHGGTLVARREGAELSTRPVTLPTSLAFVVLFSGVSASTPELVGKVRAFGAAEPREYGRLMDGLHEAAEAAERAADAGDGAALVRALDAQLAGFTALGAGARAGIVTPEVSRLAAVARAEGGVVLPAGAGGGDIAVFVGPAAPSAALRAAFDTERHVALDLTLGARGLHLAPP